MACTVVVPGTGRRASSDRLTWHVTVTVTSPSATTGSKFIDSHIEDPSRTVTAASSSATPIAVSASRAMLIVRALCLAADSTAAWAEFIRPRR